MLKADHKKDEDKPRKTEKEKLLVQTRLYDLIRFNIYLGIFFCFLFVNFTHIVVYIFGGSKWLQTSAPYLLSWYCVYIPIMGINGILESFVQVIATPEIIKQQSKNMLVNFLVSSGLGLLIVGRFEAGVLVMNMANMILRIWFCGSITLRYFKTRNNNWKVTGSVWWMAIVSFMVTYITQGSIKVLLGGICGIGLLLIIWQKERLVLSKYRKQS
jgi:oligosaccharide translocation protein RFT1